MSNTSLSESKKPISNSNPHHVLIVDDDYEVTETLRIALTAEGFSVSIATDGNQGLAYVEARTPDLVILDMMMPRRSGFFGSRKGCASTAIHLYLVIMITGNEGSRHREYAEMLGVSDYIYKPFTMDRLLSSVSNLLSK